MSSAEIISEALNLPLSDRLLIVNKLVESFNPMDANVEKEWLKELKDRKELLGRDKLETVSYKAFFGEN
jgi:hypothetical protein